MNSTSDTIVALATPPGKGGVGVIRVSGPEALSITKHIVKSDLKPRHAHYLSFYNHTNEVLDQGLAIYFKNPHSFTGEDVVELQGHGGPIVLDLIIKELIRLGARMAKPGEFSERAFLNDKLDLAQAEAIADLINASSEHAAKSALKSLQGDFSSKINTLVEALISLRLYVEAAIDFPEEEIDFLTDGKVQLDLNNLLREISLLQKQAEQGAILREGMTVVLAGKPNAGKSSLLNALAGRESAIVTDIPGTTRDVLKEYINIDGMPLHIVDTAGLRLASDEVEKIGIQRAWKEIEDADRLLLVVDITEENSENAAEQVLQDLKKNITKLPPITLVNNKCDLKGVEEKFEPSSDNSNEKIWLSAKSNHGIGLLREHLKTIMGYNTSTEGVFIARRRHVEAINLAHEKVQQALHQLTDFNAGELVAEELRLAQLSLSEITGEFTADDLLGKIFSSFCIGK
ncbi:MAG: tRNA uridine-5-carboxymethylaminomethyl(34) synthesis GTPase MnmE [Gammaproteobacteria bacterium]|nr:tRNA uridine-5-carboxymethylaminomethyl(34) synthesis GTPase MnmE [Gammaproteobacteria bacterium]